VLNEILNPHYYQAPCKQRLLRWIKFTWKYQITGAPVTEWKNAIHKCAREPSPLHYYFLIYFGNPRNFDLRAGRQQLRLFSPSLEANGSFCKSKIKYLSATPRNTFLMPFAALGWCYSFTRRTPRRCCARVIKVEK
jgi:hypothetical protein